MKLIIPNMVWHGDRERVLSIAFHPFLNLLVTGGSDGQKRPEPDDEEGSQFQEDIGYIKMWEIIPNFTQQQIVKFLGALDGGHTSTVNCLKFSPNGQYLASGSDDHQIMIWERRRRAKMGSTEVKLTWCETKPLRGHNKEVYDLCWSNCGNFLVSASLDNRAILWNVGKQKLIQVMDGHTSYVQGVIIDPKMKFVITISQDRSARVWKNTKSKKQQQHQYYIAHVIKKLESKNQDQNIQVEPCDQDHIQNQVSFKIFLDENVIFTFIRRPDWSPDGSFFILPCGQFQQQNSKLSLGAFLFIRSQPQTPALFLNTNNKPAIVVRFCPIIFKKEKDNQFSLIDVPYKMVFAIATIDQVLIYNTQNLTPIAIFGNMHFASITEMSFRGSSLLGVSSCDGFCSFIHFTQGELGEEYTEDLSSELDEELKGLIFKQDYYNTQPIKQTQLTEAEQSQQANQVQRTEMIETTDGQFKKRIIPKVIGNI